MHEINFYMNFNYFFFFFIHLIFKSILNTFQILHQTLEYLILDLTFFLNIF